MPKVKSHKKSVKKRLVALVLFERELRDVETRRPGETLSAFIRAAIRQHASERREREG
jgi:hypothetical protein